MTPPATTLTIDFGQRTTVQIVRNYGAVDWTFNCLMIKPVTGFLAASDYDFIDDWAAMLDVVGHILSDANLRKALGDVNAALSGINPPGTLNMLAVVDRWYRFHTATPVAGGTE